MNEKNHQCVKQSPHFHKQVGWGTRLAMSPLWLPSALLGTSEPHGAVVARDVVAHLLLSTGREADRAGVHPAPGVVVVYEPDYYCDHIQNHCQIIMTLIMIIKTKHNDQGEVRPVGVVLHRVEPGPRPHVLLVGKNIKIDVYTLQNISSNNT